MFGAATAALLVCMAMTLARSILGPTVFDRVLAVNSFGTKTVLLIAVYGFLSGRPDFLDLALVYALMNFIGTIGISRSRPFSAGSFSAQAPPSSWPAGSASSACPISTVASTPPASPTPWGRG